VKKILLFSRDPGGANLIVAVQAALKKDFDLHIYGKDAALSVYKKHGLEYKNIKDNCFPITQDKIYKFVYSQKFDVILTSTSADDFTERLLWLAAIKCHIYHAAMLDQWMNYSLRFLKSHKSHQTKEKYYLNEYILPQNIFVMDEYAKQSMISEGLPCEIIKVTGQPYFEYFSKKYTQQSTRAFKKNRISWLFASEPITSVYGKEKGKAIYGYTEQSILYEICNTLNDLPCNNIDIKIKQHPRDNSGVYSEICNQFSFASLTDSDVTQAVIQSDAVLGMSSTLLLEAALLNKPIQSIQLNLKMKSPFILDQLGKSKSILNKEELKERLKLLIKHNDNSKNSKFVVNFESHQNAINNIVLNIKKGLKI